MAYDRGKYLEYVASVRKAAIAEMSAALIDEYAETVDGKSVIVRVYAARYAGGVYRKSALGRTRIEEFLL